MSLIVVDTDVASYLFKHDTRALQYLPYLNNNNLIISFMSKAELSLWSLTNNWGEQRRSDLEEFINRNFTIYTVTLPLCQRWAILMQQSKLLGKNLAASDAWIAATALELNASLATNNRKDYDWIPNLQLL